MSAFIGLKGKEFGRLVVVERAKNAKNNRIRWKCRCGCGKLVIALSYHLLSGHTQSCGCLQKEIAGKLFTKHGMRRTVGYNRIIKLGQEVCSGIRQEKNIMLALPL